MITSGRDSDLRYDIKWVGRCTFEGSDKIWGWFIYTDPTESNRSNRSNPRYAYTFWARTGKTPSFKKHHYSAYNLKKLTDKKVDRKYSPISQGELVNLWPRFFEDMDNKFIFHLLANDI